MDEVKFKLDNACRTCATFTTDETLIPIYDEVEITTGITTIFRINEELELMNIEIKEDDNLPQQICISCIKELKNFHVFRDLCRLAQSALTEYFINSTSQIKMINETSSNTFYETNSIIYQDDIEKSDEEFLNLNGITEIKTKNIIKTDTNYFDHRNSTDSNSINEANLEILQDKELIFDEQDSVSEDIEYIGDSNAYVIEIETLSDEKIATENFENDSVRLLKNKTNLNSSDEKISKGVQDEFFTVETNNNEDIDFMEKTENTLEIESKNICIEKIEKLTTDIVENNSQCSLIPNENQSNSHTFDKMNSSSLQDCEGICEIETTTNEKNNAFEVNGKTVVKSDDSENFIAYKAKMISCIFEKDTQEKTCENLIETLSHCRNCLCYAHKSTKIFHKKCKLIENAFTCYYCTDRFNTKNEVENHIYEIHPPDRPYICPICKETFDTSSNCEKHLEKYHSDIKKPFTCDICNSKCLNLSELKRHKRSLHVIGDYECYICHERFENAKRYEYHVKSHSTDKPFKCKYCEKSFLQSHHLKNHETIHTRERPYACEECGKTFIYSDNYSLHMQKHRGSVRNLCEVCGSDFSKKKDLYNHMRQKHSMNLEKNEIKHWCSICCRGFRLLYNFKCHIKVHEKHQKLAPEKVIIKENKVDDEQKNNDNNNEKGPFEEIKELFNCPICSKNFISPFGLKKHIKMHDQSRKYPCEVCGVRYKRSEHLKQHMNIEHLKIKKYPCSYCGKIFVSCTARNSHEISHKDEKIQCSYCDKILKTKRHAKLHERSHTLEKPYICPICGEKFVFIPSFWAHQKWHSKEEQMKMKEIVLADNLEISQATNGG